MKIPEKRLLPQKKLFLCFRNEIKKFIIESNVSELSLRNNGNFNREYKFKQHSNAELNVK